MESPGDNYHVVIDLLLNRYGSSTAAGHSSTSAAPVASLSPTPSERDAEDEEAKSPATKKMKSSPARS